MMYSLTLIFITIVSVQYLNSQSVEKLTDNDIPDECKQQNYCTIKPQNYPQEKFDALFTGLKMVSTPYVEAMDVIENRIGGQDENDDCAVKISYEPLYRAKSLNGDWRTVVQSPANKYIQRVRIEKCRRPGGNCFRPYPSVPGFVITSCKQKYNVWEVLVESDNGTETIRAELPVCCSCTYKIV